MTKQRNKKQACRCGHGKTIHHIDYGITGPMKRNPCSHPGCGCKDYDREGHNSWGAAASQNNSALKK
jgi:hypothetical protein